jgi:hypothetical protein
LNASVDPSAGVPQSSAAVPTPAPSPPRRAVLVLAGGILLLAVVEAGGALLSPLRTPSDADWAAAAGWVRSQHQPQDLLIAAPAWADQVLRLHLGDLQPPKKAARLDEATFPRVWVLSQRGADSDEGVEDAPGTRLREQRKFGQLTVRLYERPAVPVRYDFYEGWAAAHVARVEAGGRAVPCAPGADGHTCGDLPFNFIKPRVLEIGGKLRRGLLVLPVAGATMAMEYPQAPLGKELVVGAGLHNVWRRKNGEGTVVLRVLVDGREVGRIESGNRTGWTVSHFPTPAWAGRTASVRFEISSAQPQSRHFGFAVEARGS